MRALAEYNDEFTAKGATLIALTPENPDYSAATVDKNEVNFQVLTDTDLQVADQYGLVFDLTTITGIYEKFGELSKRNGEATKDKLPLTATYLIDQVGIIRYAFLDTDYKRRAEPKQILEELGKLTSN